MMETLSETDSDYNEADNSTWMNYTAIDTSGKIFDDVLIPKDIQNGIPTVSLKEV
jgi:hypothetical protein